MDEIHKEKTIKGHTNVQIASVQVWRHSRLNTIETLYILRHLVATTNSIYSSYFTNVSIWTWSPIVGLTNTLTKVRIAK
ncbi:hypothetical protein BLOT_004381 [Blomia tropicalis]|nr:hypothetical protein BLOT_004381 [Blomia tropicalis]